jgi:hypothetical protein
MFELWPGALPRRALPENLNALGLRNRRGNLFEGRPVEYILSIPLYRLLRRGNPGHDRFYQDRT